jgi:anthranilate phosphoribosyltransferase
VGVFDRSWVRRLAEVLGLLGAEHAFVVHGSDGMDEVTLTGPSWVAEWRAGRVHEHVIEPGTFGLDCVTADAFTGGDPAENATRLRAILDGNDQSPARDLVAANAAAALLVGGVASDLRSGYELARAALDSGRAGRTLDRLCASSREPA